MIRLSSMSQIAKSTSPPVVCAALIVVLCLLPGCGVGPQAEFKYRDSTNKLIGDAQKAMTKTLQEGFGTGIRHYCTMGLNSKEANNEALAEQVMD